MHSRAVRGGQCGSHPHSPRGHIPSAELRAQPRSFAPSKEIGGLGQQLAGRPKCAKCARKQGLRVCTQAQPNLRNSQSARAARSRAALAARCARLRCAAACALAARHVLCWSMLLAWHRVRSDSSARARQRQQAGGACSGNRSMHGVRAGSARARLGRASAATSDSEPPRGRVAGQRHAAMRCVCARGNTFGPSHPPRCSLRRCSSASCALALALAGARLL